MANNKKKNKGMVLPMFPEHNLYSPLLTAVKRGTATYLQNTAELEERIGMKESIERVAPEYTDPNPLHRRSLGQRLDRSISSYYNLMPQEGKPHYLDEQENLLQMFLNSQRPRGTSGAIPRQGSSGRMY